MCDDPIKIFGRDEHIDPMDVRTTTYPISLRGGLKIHLLDAVGFAYGIYQGSLAILGAADPRNPFLHHLIPLERFFNENSKIAVFNFAVSGSHMMAPLYAPCHETRKTSEEALDGKIRKVTRVNTDTGPYVKIPSFREIPEDQRGIGSVKVVFRRFSVMHGCAYVIVYAAAPELRVV